MNVYKVQFTSIRMHSHMMWYEKKKKKKTVSQDVAIRSIEILSWNRTEMRNQSLTVHNTIHTFSKLLISPALDRTIYPPPRKS